ncbi:MAG: 3'-5' exonuclease [bacterium]
MEDFKKLQLVIVDVETTGMNPNEGHSVIEVAGQKIQGEEILSTFESLIRISKLLPAESQAIHGITDEMLAESGRPVLDVFNEFREFTNGCVLVGHNIGFDMSFINSEYSRLEQPHLENETLDTLALAKRYLIIPSYSLKNVAAYLKVSQPEAHRALADVDVTRQVLLKLIERARQAK